MRFRAPLTGLVIGAAFGAYLTLGMSAKLFPLPMNYLAVPGIALTWGRSTSWWAVVVVNAAVYGMAGFLVGAAAALLSRDSKRAPRA